MRHGATIVPFSAVGAEDSFSIVADSDDILKLPFVGDFARELGSGVPRARNVDSRVTEDGEEEESFVSPLVGQCKLTVSKIMMKAPLVSALETII